MRQQEVLTFLHIGKTGGTALRSVFLQAGAPIDTPFGRIELPNAHDATLHSTPGNVFFFLRDPLTRFVSGFWSRYRQGRPTYNNPWRDFEAEIFTVLSTPNAMALALQSDNSTIRELAHGGMARIVHLKRYSNWLGAPADFEANASRVVFVGFQETLAQDFERLKVRLDLPPHWILPTDGPAVHRTPEGYDRRLDPKAAEILRDWYREDYDLMSRCRALMNVW